MKTKILLFGMLSLCYSSISLGEVALSYPELEVTPRATERLKMLVEKEKKNHLFSQLPMQISAISTLTTGLLQLSDVDTTKDLAKKSPNAGIVVGAAWIGINYYVGQKYHIYEDVLADISRIPGNTPRDQLIRERIAEEGINRAARLAVRLKWISVATNLGANGYMLKNAKKESSAQVMGAFSILASFAPLLFVSDWETVAADQSAYKKRVYGPIFTTSIFETSKDKFHPGFLVSTTF